MHFDYAPPEWLKWFDKPTAGLPIAVPIVGFNVLIDKLLLAIDGRLSMGLCSGSPKSNFQHVSLSRLLGYPNRTNWWLSYQSISRCLKFRHRQSLDSLPLKKAFLERHVANKRPAQSDPLMTFRGFWRLVHQISHKLLFYLLLLLVAPN